MNKTVTATYESTEALRNVVGDLLGFAGIPQEQFFVDESKHQIKVITPGDIEPEIMELLKSHHPTKVAERSGPESRYG